MITRNIIDIMNSLYMMCVDNRYSKNGELFSRKQGIYFTVHLSDTCHGYGKSCGNTHHKEWEGNGYAEFHVIMLNHRQVFVCVPEEDPGVLDIPAPELWKNTSNHDSCWRQGCDELTRLAFLVHDEAWKNCPEKERPETKLQNLDISLCRIGAQGRIFKFVEVEMERIDPRGHNYFNRLTSIKLMEDVEVKF